MNHGVPAPPHILIVEDDESIRMLVSTICRRIGVSSTSAANGAEAIRILDQGVEFCAIILDLMMPGIDGPQVLEHLKRIDRDIPVIIATAAVRAAQTTEFDPRWVKAVVTKPFDIDKLEAAIKDARTCGDAR